MFRGLTQLHPFEVLGSSQVLCSSVPRPPGSCREAGPSRPCARLALPCGEWVLEMELFPFPRLETEPR